MFAFFKYLPLLLGLKDVANVYKQETGEDKPWYLSRTFLGSAIAFIFTCLAVFFGISYTGDDIEVIVNNIYTIITTCVALYGVVMTFVGQIKKKTPEGK